MMKRLLAGQGLAKNLVLIKVDKQVKAIFEQIGSRRIKWMIENKKQFYDILTGEQMMKMAAAFFGVEEATQEQLAKALRSYAWAESAITDADFRHMLPIWADSMIKEIEGGEQWFTELVGWIRSLFRNE